MQKYPLIEGNPMYSNTLFEIWNYPFEVWNSTPNHVEKHFEEKIAPITQWKFTGNVARTRFNEGSKLVLTFHKVQDATKCDDADFYRRIYTI